MGQTDQSGNSNPAKSPQDEAAKSFNITSEPVVHGALEQDVHKYEATTESVVHNTTTQEGLGELPASYGEDTLFLVARDPNWLFCYWDLNWSRFQAADMKDSQYRIYLKTFKSGAEDSVTQVNPEARNWYIQVDSPGTSYRVELGYHDADNNWATVLSSNEASTPSASVAGDEGRADFATIPYHLTFERLLEMVKDGMAKGESLMTALKRVQGEASDLAKGAIPNWTDEQKRLLAVLLGESMTDVVSMGSEEIDLLLRKRLAERLNTESASELAALGRLNEVFGPGDSSLFSARGGASLFGALGESSLFSALGGASLFRALGESSLFSALGGASLFRALGESSLSSAFGGASLFRALGESSLSSAFGGASFFRELGGASLFSALGGASLFNALGGASLSSALGGASLFSGVGASWSAQPFSIESRRGFFMHVNAEVIFYGGTHPDAKVTIDGQPITLRPDGSFSYHFKLPDGKFEIPIVAESPDGKEKRSATLTFERKTTREGEVEHTVQPAYLSEPMGRKS